LFYRGTGKLIFWGLFHAVLRKEQTVPFNNRGGSTAARGGYKNMTAVLPLPYFAYLVGCTDWGGKSGTISHGVLIAALWVGAGVFAPLLFFAFMKKICGAKRAAIMIWENCGA
jgi:hypothetical protein